MVFCSHLVHLTETLIDCHCWRFGFQEMLTVVFPHELIGDYTYMLCWLIIGINLLLTL
jgi:hypothetical protein